MRNFFAAFALICFINVNHCQANSIEIIDVIDGDTILINNNGVVKYVYINGVDAPEIGQPFSVEAKEYVRQILSDHDCSVNLTIINGINVANIYCTNNKTKINTDLSCMIILTGYGYYQRERYEQKHFNSEKYAKNHKVGVWSSETREYPWDYRKKHAIVEAEEYSRNALYNAVIDKLSISNKGKPAEFYGSFEECLVGTRNYLLKNISYDNLMPGTINFATNEATLYCAPAFGRKVDIITNNNVKSINTKSSFTKESECSSDYDCGFDGRCVKNKNNGGVCIKKDQCFSDYDCEFGYKCIKQNLGFSTCLKN